MSSCLTELLDHTSVGLLDCRPTDNRVVSFRYASNAEQDHRRGDSTSRQPHRDGLQKGRRIGVHVMPPDKQGSMGVQQVEQQDILGSSSCQQVPHVHSFGTCLTCPISLSLEIPAKMPNNAVLMHVSCESIKPASVP